VYYLVDFAKPEDWDRIFAAMVATGQHRVKVVTGTRGVVQYFELTSPEVDLVPEESAFFIALDGAAQCPFLVLNLETCEYACGIQEIKPLACRAFDNPINCWDTRSKFGLQPLPDLCEDCMEFLEADGEDDGENAFDDISIANEQGGGDAPLLRPPCERQSDGVDFECPYGHHELRRAYETKWCLDHLETYDFAPVVEDARKWLQKRGNAQFKDEDSINEFWTDKVKFLDLNAFSGNLSGKNAIFFKLREKLEKNGLTRN